MQSHIIQNGRLVLVDAVVSCAFGSDLHKNPINRLPGINIFYLILFFVLLILRLINVLVEQMLYTNICS